MSKPNETAPEDCPTPGYHETHRYCPSCTWTEPRCGVPCEGLAEYFEKVPTCTLAPGHEGKHGGGGATWRI